MRFTDKKGNIIYWWHKRNEPEEIYKQELANQKLCQLEDIEEEFGIDLVTLFKALNECYVKLDDIIFKGRGTLVSENRIGIIVKFSEYQTTSKLCYLRDYGKTWALTKEELEK